MKSNIFEVESKSSNISINKELTDKYKDKNLFANKLNWAKEHFKNRDLFKEIEAIESKEKNHEAITQY
jgi:septum formation inhibitor MinC